VVKNVVKTLTRHGFNIGVALLHLSSIFDSRKNREKRGTITMDALRMLAKADVSIKSGEFGECRWRGGGINLRRFTSGNFFQQVMNGEIFARLPRDAFRVDSVVATL